MLRFLYKDEVKRRRDREVVLKKGVLGKRREGLCFFQLLIDEGEGRRRETVLEVMSSKMQRHHTVAVRLDERLWVKRSNRFIQLTKGRLLSMLLVWIILIAGVSVCIYNKMEDDNLERRMEVLVTMCDQRARMLQDQFSVSVNHVHALAILVSTFHYYRNPSAIDQGTFAEYTAGTAFERPLLSGVAYAQRVVHSERDFFEKHQGWLIKTMEREPSPPRDEYAPVIFSQQTVSYIESLDMMSGEEDRENILRARATGKAVLTSPFRLLGSHHLGVVLTFPVYNSTLPADASVEERIQSTAGYLGGAFDVETLVENLLGQLAGKQAIVVNVYDVTNSSEPLIMYGTHHPDGDVSLSHISLLDFGDPFRTHQMRCRYLQRPPTPWMAISSAVGFFVIFLLVGYIFYGAGIHIVKIEEDFTQMQELKVRAEAADVAKSQFLATVSHEIRTPMNGVLGMLSMLLDTNLAPPQRDYAQTAQACGKALITLINEVLDRAKIEAGKLELEAVPFDLRSILDDVLSLFSGKSRDKGIELAVFVSDKVPELLLGDPGRFRQIITNLVGNSIKFTERGHIFVQVHLVDQIKPVLDAKVGMHLKRGSSRVGVMPIPGSCLFNTLSGYEAADDHNSWENFKYLIAHEEFHSNVSRKWTTSGETCDNVTLMISVEDTGIGIPICAQERVFTPFMQADSSTSRNYGGTGIGLSISKCLVEMMGGQITFISRPQVGSTFTFTAALRRCEKYSLNDLKKPLSEPLPTSFKGMKAIIVDGKPVRRVVTKYHLQRLGIQVDLAPNIKLALGMVSWQNGVSKSGNGKRIDMILVEKDSWISNSEGLLPERLIDWKKHAGSAELTKMILLATSISREETSKAKTAGFEDTVIMKPLRASMIAACLQQVLGVGTKGQGKDLPNGSAYLHSLLKGRKILVVDDNKVNRRVAHGALKKFGAIVECVESGKIALGLLELPHNFDACFMDIQMPEMDGFEATRLIRQMESAANEKIKKGGSAAMAEYHMPILAMTADVIQATYEECLKCGMDGYVSKPFEEEKLYQAVAKFFEFKPISSSYPDGSQITG